MFMKQKIILASTSPRRKELLRQIGLDFDVAPSDFEEDMSQKLSHKELAKTLALGKARAAAGKFKKGIIIGGEIKALNLIRAKSAGSSAGIMTTLQAGYDYISADK